MSQLSRALRITPGDVVAFVGGGGKTTAMFRLADELAQTGPAKLRIITTTTTRIFAAQVNQTPAHVTFDPGRQTLGDILPRVNGALDRHDHVLLIGRADAKSGKAFGVDPETIDELAATGQFDVIIIEADGSRMRPLKAPAEHEPVIPPSTTVVVPVAGIDALGQDLRDDTVHRAELVSQLSGTPVGQPITEKTISTLLCHPECGLKAVPTGARVVPLLNKVEHSSQLAAARAIARNSLHCNQIEGVAIGAVQSTDEPILELQGRTAAVILAAGGASRFGSPKQLAQWRGETLIERVAKVALASRAGPVIVVLGAELERSRAALDGLPVRIVTNVNWAAGQSTSMQAGLAALASNVDSVIFLLVDLPAVTPALVNALIDRHRQTLAPIVWPEFEGRRGNPVLFDRVLFEELRQVTGDSGGRAVLMANQEEAERVAVTDESILWDIDRPDDLLAYS
jgi:molybdenum cofactor cytidylyltransferase